MASEKGEKPLHELLSSTMVDLYVGPDATHWILHEKLLCHHSPFFRQTFYGSNKSSSTKSFGLPDMDDEPFELFVGWLYSRALRYPEEERSIGPLLDLYLMSEKFGIAKLGEDVVETVRAFYHNNETYPGLRRVQYVYANTEEDSPMREMMVGSVARYLTLSETIPAHWEKALKRNGQLAVDIIRSIQEWHLESRSVPDARDVSVVDRGRGQGMGFSAVEEKEDSSMMSGGKEEGQGEVQAKENGNGNVEANGRG